MAVIGAYRESVGIPLLSGFLSVMHNQQRLEPFSMSDYVLS